MLCSWLHYQESESTRREGVGLPANISVPYKAASQQSLWARKIPRKDYVITANSGVCILHFQKDGVVTGDFLPTANGKLVGKLSINLGLHTVVGLTYLYIR